MTDLANNVEVKVLSKEQIPVHATTFTSERRRRLDALLIPVIPENLLQYFPDYAHDETFQDSQQRLANGRAYWCAAIDPQTSAYAGCVFVNCEQHNLFSIETKAEYQRRAIARQLIHHLQNRFAELTLDNTGGEVSRELYTKMGFKPVEQHPGRFVWTRPKPTDLENQRRTNVNNAVEYLATAAEAAESINPIQMVGGADHNYSLWTDPMERSRSGVVFQIGFRPPVKNIANIIRISLGTIISPETATEFARIALAKPNYMPQNAIETLTAVHSDMRPEHETFYMETEMQSLPAIFAPRTISSPLYTPPEYEALLKGIARADVSARYSRHPFRLITVREPTRDESLKYDNPRQGLIISIYHPLDPQLRQILFPIEIDGNNAMSMIHRFIKASLVDIRQIGNKT